MSKAIVRTIPLDPEFQAVYDAEVLPRKSDTSPKAGHSPSVSDPIDEIDELKQLADNHRKHGINRKQFASGSFDQVEADATNIINLGIAYLTRPL
jgi:hypothetical protein